MHRAGLNGCLRRSRRPANAAAAFRVQKWVRRACTEDSSGRKGGRRTARYPHDRSCCLPLNAERQRRFATDPSRAGGSKPEGPTLEHQLALLAGVPCRCLDVFLKTRNRLVGGERRRQACFPRRPAWRFRSSWRASRDSPRGGTPQCRQVPVKAKRLRRARPDARQTWTRLEEKSLSPGWRLSMQRRWRLHLWFTCVCHFGSTL